MRAGSSALAPERYRARSRPWKQFGAGDRIASWDALARRASEPNPFYESWFLLPALEQFDPHAKVFLFTLEADGELVGLVPLRRYYSYYGHPLPHVRGWTHDNCFLGAPLVARGFENLFWNKLLDWADRNTRIALFVHLAHMAASGDLHAALARTVTAHQRPAAKVMEQERAMLESALSPEDYFEQSLSTKKRKELRRQERRLSEMGEVEYERTLSADGLDAWIADFLALEARGWKGAEGSSLANDARTESVFRSALTGAARRGRLERVTMRLDGQAIAMLANFITPPGAFSFKTTFAEGLSRFSPGVLLQKENLQILQQGGVEWIDSCAAPDHPMINHFWRERRGIARYSIGIGSKLRRAVFSKVVRYETGSASGGI